MKKYLSKLVIIILSVITLSTFTIGCSSKKDDVVSKDEEVEVFTTDDGLYDISVPKSETWSDHTPLQYSSLSKESKTVNQSLDLSTRNKYLIPSDTPRSYANDCVIKGLSQVYTKLDHTELKDVTINGMKGVQFELIGQSSTLKVSKLITIVYDNVNFIKLTLSTAPDDFEKTKPSLYKIASSFKQTKNEKKYDDVIAVKTSDNLFEISLPKCENWKDVDIDSAKSLYLRKKSINSDIEVDVSSDNKSSIGVFTAKDYANLYISALKNTCKQVTTTAFKPVTVNKMAGIQFEAYGTDSSGGHSFLFTAVDFGDKLTITALSCSFSVFNAKKVLLYDIANSIKQTNETPKAEELEVFKTSDNLHEISLSKSQSWININEPSDLIVFEKQSIKLNCALTIIKESKTKFAKDITLKDYTKLNIEMFQQTFQNFTNKEPKNITINNINGLQFEASGEPSKVKISYLITCLDTGNDFIRIAIWSSTDNFNNLKPSFAKITNSFK